MRKVRVALLGATSHIARGLIASFLGRPGYELALHARAPERVQAFVDRFGGGPAEVLPLAAFGERKCDVVINCIGIGDPGRLQADPAAILDLTLHWDSAVLDFLARHPDALCIHFSSGAAYGSDFSRPADDTTPASFPLNALSGADWYGIAKLHAEARHRAATGLNIVDLRVFGYFSRFVDLSSRFLMAEIVLALRQGSELLTTADDIVRDYVHPEDLAAAVEHCIARRRLNGAYDLYSRDPVRKFAILEEFSRRFGLRYRIADDAAPVSATGAKAHYYSLSRRAADLGYQPAFTSLESLCSETAALLAGAEEGGRG